jgi:hypothetical protein
MVEYSTWPGHIKAAQGIPEAAGKSRFYPSESLKRLQWCWVGNAGSGLSGQFQQGPFSSVA